MDEQTVKDQPPSVGPAFEWRRRKQGWACYRVFYAAHRRRSLDTPVMLPASRWEEMQERLSGDELVVTLANWVLGRMIDREEEMRAKFPWRIETYAD